MVVGPDMKSAMVNISNAQIIGYHHYILILKIKKLKVSRDQSTKSKETRNKILAQENTKV